MSVHSKIDSVAKRKQICVGFVKLFGKFISQNRSRLWIILVGLYAIPYLLAVIGSVLYPQNNLFVILAALATSEGIGSISIVIKKWGQKPKSRPRKNRKGDGKSGNANNGVLDRYVM